jgi:hypothetical protein
MRIYVVLVALVLSTLLSFSCSALPVLAALSWTVQTVDENGGGIYCPIVLDSNNTTHIAYASLVNETFFVKYASWNGSGFSTQTIGVGQGVYNLVLDSNDNPHILYNNPYGGNHLIYASVSGTNWNIQTVDNLPEGPIQLSFVSDSNNTSYILYHTPKSYQDKNTGLNYTSIDIKLATLKNSIWSIQTIPLPPPIYDNSNIVLDSKGNPHFICTQDHYRSSVDVNLNYKVFYVSWDGSAWRTQTVIPNFPAQDYGHSPSGFLSLDSKDYPHVVSFISESSRLTYSSWTGSTWNIMDSNISASWPCYLALDTNDNPHVSYTTNTGARWTDALMYATATETTRTTSPAVPDSTNLTVAAVAIIASVAALTYIWRKKMSPVKKNAMKD